MAVRSVKPLISESMFGDCHARQATLGTFYRKTQFQASATKMASTKAETNKNSVKAKTIDSHLHIWASPQEAADKCPYFPGQNPTLPGHLDILLQCMEEASVDGALIVQPINHKFDHSQVTSVLKKYPSKFVGCCLANPAEDGNGVKQLEDLILKDGYQAVRFNPYLWPSGQQMTNEVGKAMFSKAGELGVPVGFMCMKHHEELVGIYASQLASHRCVDLFVYMMELRLNSSVHVKYKIFLSAMEYLPFFPGDDLKGSFEEIIERLLSRSRETKIRKYDESSDVVEQHRLHSLQKALVVQWLCFTPPSTITDVKDVSAKLLLRALIHSNILFREFALISMWSVPAMPIGAHELLSLLAEPLKQHSETPDTLEDYVVENLKEFQDWSEYYSCDATYRNWLKIELANADVSPIELSVEEKQRAIAAAHETLNLSLSLLLREENPWLIFVEEHVNESMEPLFLELHATAMLRLPSGEPMCPDATVCAALMSALYSSVTEEVVLERQLMVNVAISSRDSYSIEVVLRCLAVEGDGIGSHILNDGGLLGSVVAAGFKGELARFQAGLTMKISGLDAWFSSKDGCLEGPATYVVRGLCRRCCIPEVILRCMQVSASLMESGNPHESHDQLIELVSSLETGFIHLFSQQQLQEFLLFEREYSICKMEIQEELSS